MSSDGAAEPDLSVPPKPTGVTDEGSLAEGSALWLSLRMHEHRRHFVVESARRTRSRRREVRYFLDSADGWLQAWDAFSAGDPRAARRLAIDLRHRAKQADAEHQRRTAAAADRSEQQRLRELEPHLADVHSCVVYSQYGIPGLHSGINASLYFLANGLLLQDLRGERTFVQMTYSSIINLVVDGPGTVTTGGGFVGGGFGVKGAVEGMLMATVLNKLTTQTTVTSFIEIQDAERHVVLSNDRDAPDVLALRLRPVFARIRAAQATSHQPEGGIKVDAEQQPALADQLAKLAQLHSSGALTDVEYTAAKALVLGL